MTNKLPALGKLIVELQSNEHVSQGGIVFADSFENPTQRTKIIAVGLRRTWTSTEAMNYRVGDYAYIKKHTGLDIGFDELVINEEDILYTSIE